MSNIARRTRSHISIDDDILNTDNLDFPDVDENLYQNPGSNSDPVYRDFLNQIYSDEVGQGTDTNTEDNDPPYVLNNDIFSPGWRYDVREGLAQGQLEQLRQQQYQQLQLQQQQVISDLTPVPPASQHIEEEIFGQDFARVLNQQLRQHIQLLAQTYLLAKSTKNTQKEADEAKEHLNSYVEIFTHRKKPANLSPAIQLVNDFGTPKELKSFIRLSWRHLPVPEAVKQIIDQNVNVFPYEDLLPRVAFSRLPDRLVTKRPKSEFTLNEDKLLALALDEFKGETAQYAYIASLLLPAKTRKQIADHIKNIKRNKVNKDHNKNTKREQGSEDNPIRSYISSGRLPRIDLDGDNRLRDYRPPCQPSNQQLPKLEPQQEQSQYKHQDGPSEQQTSPEQQQQQSPPQQRQQLQLPLQQHTDQSQQHFFQLQPQKQQQQECSQHLVLSCQKQFVASHQPHQDYQQSHQEDQQHLGWQQNQDCEQQQLMDVDDNCNLTGETMNMDDLMAASTTISKHNNSNISEKSIRSLKLRKSIMDLMSHKFLISEELLTDLMRKEAKKDNSSQKSVKIYNEISKFLKKIEAPSELHERLVLFLNLDSATECDCAFNYLHWMRIIQFVQHVELYHEGEGVEKKLGRLVDAIQKGDSHKVKLAAANLINKHPLLRREYEALALDGKPHPSLFANEEDFDDQTEPFLVYDSKQEDYSQFEHFENKLTQDEMNYASQSCPCKCHQRSSQQEELQHCGKCNLKLMKGRMYLVSKKKPCLAEWSYVDKQPDSISPTPASSLNQSDERYSKSGSPPSLPASQPIPELQSLSSSQPPLEPSFLLEQPLQSSPPPPPPVEEVNVRPLEWTFEEDKEILEFCQAKSLQHDESTSFDTSTFEELVERRANQGSASYKSATQIAERFNHLYKRMMEMYKRDE